LIVRHNDQFFNQALTTNLVLRACDAAGEPAAALSALLPLLRESAAAGLASRMLTRRLYSSLLMRHE